MGDLALRWEPGAGGADLAVESDDLATDDGLRTAIYLSLFLDARARADDPLPSDDGDRRGWWGDEFAEVADDRIGSRLWLLNRSKITESLARRSEDYDREALQWLLEDRVASQIDVAVDVSTGRSLHYVKVHRPTGSALEFKFSHAWNGEAAAAEV